MGRGRVVMLALAVALGGSWLSGCASLEAGRLYVSGTEALDRGETTRAVRELEEAARLRPGASEIQNHLGLAYAASGRDAEAMRAFERAVALDCDNRAAQENLDVARRRLFPERPLPGASGRAAP